MFEVETTNLDDPELVEVDRKMKARVSNHFQNGILFCSLQKN